MDNVQSVKFKRFRTVLLLFKLSSYEYYFQYGDPTFVTSVAGKFYIVGWFTTILKTKVWCFGK